MTGVTTDGGRRSITEVTTVRRFEDGGRKSVTGATTKRRWNDGGSSTVSGVTTHRGRRSLTGVMEDSHWSGA